MKRLSFQFLPREVPSLASSLTWVAAHDDPFPTLPTMIHNPVHRGTLRL